MSTQVKTALVTGSSSGIGLDIARAFLDRDMSVVLNGRNVEKLSAAAEKLGHSERVAVVAGSISDRETGEAMVRAAVDRFGSADELAPEPLGDGPTQHMMCSIPGGIRTEFIAPAA